MDHTLLPPTPKQVDFAQSIAARLKAQIPDSSANDRRALSEWISRNQSKLKSYVKHDSARGRGATSKQVALAENIARRKRIEVPPECFQDAGTMSRWIGRQL